jgi:hypothetical protein
MNTRQAGGDGPALDIVVVSSTGAMGHLDKCFASLERSESAAEHEAPQAPAGAEAEK